MLWHQYQFTLRVSSTYYLLVFINCALSLFICFSVPFFSSCIASLHLYKHDGNGVSLLWPWWVWHLTPVMDPQLHSCFFCAGYGNVLYPLLWGGWCAWKEARLALLSVDPLAGDSCVFMQLVFPWYSVFLMSSQEHSWEQCHFSPYWCHCLGRIGEDAVARGGGLVDSRYPHTH